jgi:succinate dehydrogenase / fumarate reductase, flavoprotein subunit
LVFGKRAGEFAGKFAREHAAAPVHADQVDEAARVALAPLERQASGDKGGGPYQIQYELQDMMQDLVGIVRREEEMLKALEGLAALRQRAERVGVPGNREYNPGWHTALDLHNLLTVSEAIARCGLARKESRGGHFRDDFSSKVERFGKFNLVVRKGPDGRMQLEEVAIPEMPAELKQVIQENQ